MTSCRWFIFVWKSLNERVSLVRTWDRNRPATPIKATTVRMITISMGSTPIAAFGGSRGRVVRSKALFSFPSPFLEVARRVCPGQLSGHFARLAYSRLTCGREVIWGRCRVGLGRGRPVRPLGGVWMSGLTAAR